MTENHTIKTPDEWITLVKQGKDVWNEQVALLDNSDFINFLNAQIFGPIDFSGFVFPVPVYFSGAQFMTVASFVNTEFKGEVYFRNAEFNGDVYFDGAKFKNHVRFRDAKFKGGAYFRETEFSRFANFHGAEFARAADFKGAKFHMAPWFKKDVFPEDIFFNDANQFSEQFRDVEGEFAEANYRKLKLGMKSLEAHSEENAFSRLEMRARKHKEPWPQKGLYWLYEIASDYGQSVFFPLFWLPVLADIFFVLHWAMLDWASPKCALQWTLKGMLVFPGIFPATLAECELSIPRIAVVAFHWLGSAGLWFLALLGLRNRFRLK